MLEFLELPHRPQTRVYCSALLALISQEMIRELSFQRGFELLLWGVSHVKVDRCPLPSKVPAPATRDLPKRSAWEVEQTLSLVFYDLVAVALPADHAILEDLLD